MCLNDGHAVVDLSLEKEFKQGNYIEQQPGKYPAVEPVGRQLFGEHPEAVSEVVKGFFGVGLGQ